MILVKTLICLVLLLVVPIIIGSAFCGLLKLSNTLDRRLVYGVFVMWEVVQLVSIPFIIAKQSFLFVVIIISILYIVKSSNLCETMYGTTELVVQQHVLQQERLFILVAYAV